LAGSLLRGFKLLKKKRYSARQQQIGLWREELIRSIRIGDTKSFSTPQTLSLSQADGQYGSGYNAIVGANNSGKSTIITFVRYLLSTGDTVTIDRDSRREPAKPVIEVTWDRLDNEVSTIGIDNDVAGALFRKTGNRNGLSGQFRFVPSRRPFASEYNTTSGMGPYEYEHNELVNRQANQAYFDAILATAIAKYFIEPQNKALFIATLKEVDPLSTEFSADNLGGRNVMFYEGPSKKSHVLSDTGDGITNLIRIIYALVTSNPGDCLIIDEPELSLHPQLQRNLYRLLLRYSRDRQLIVVTHSPHFVGWKEISANSRLSRVYINKDGDSIIASPSKESFNAVKAHANITSRRFYDAVSKELFFADRALLVEGADDVHYLENYLEETNEKPLPFMGYGCGGASVIAPWMRLCSDMGIKCAALFDGDKQQDYENASAEFADRAVTVRTFQLFKDDIRDKHKRTDSGSETNEVLKPGVFNRKGKIHPENTSALNELLGQIRQFLD
jgi:predicted ATP-dependent endonuclease of OLD family